MSLNMLDTIDTTFQSRPAGGVELITQAPGGYTGPGGTWEPGANDPSRTLTLITIQQADMRTAQHMMDIGAMTQPSDARVVYINDGTMLYPDDDGTFSQLLRFSDGRVVREWRVAEVDNRPWRNYCKAIVVRYRGER